MDKDFSLFINKAPGIMKNLINEFSISPLQAAAILGNIGHECNGFQNLREIGQKAGRGGYGWCQWTGPRRVKFLDFCKSIGLNYTHDDANYRFLLYELSGSERRAITELRKATELVRAVQLFERFYERAGVVNLRSRVQYAAYALNAYTASDAE